MQSNNPVSGPPTKNGIGDPARIQEPLVLAEWELISATEMDYVLEIEVSAGPIELGTKTRYRRRAEPCRAVGAAIQQVKSPASPIVLE